MNVQTRPMVVYPTFHDAHQRHAPTAKEVEIDNSIYHLLSMYLDTNPLSNDSKSMTKQQRPKHSKRNAMRQQRNWFGEIKTKSTEVERNTLRNSTIATFHQDDLTHSRKSRSNRSKSVSFSETVTVFEQSAATKSRLSYQPPKTKYSLNQDKEEQDDDEDDDDSMFVDALENFVE